MKPLRGRRGAALALVVLWLPACLMAGALTVDGGRLLLARHRVQAAADLAALAAARAVDEGALARGLLRLERAAAEAAALAYARANLAAPPRLGAGPARVSVAVWPTGSPPRVTVAVTLPMRLLLVPGSAPRGVNVTATARAEVVRPRRHSTAGKR